MDNLGTAVKHIKLEDKVVHSDPATLSAAFLEALRNLIKNASLRSYNSVHHQREPEEGEKSQTASLFYRPWSTNAEEDKKNEIKRLAFYNSSYCENIDDVLPHLDKYSEVRCGQFPGFLNIQSIFGKEFHSVKFYDFNGNTAEIVAAFFGKDRIFEERATQMGEMEPFILPRNIAYSVKITRKREFYLDVFICVFKWAADEKTVTMVNMASGHFEVIEIVENTRKSTDDKFTFCISKDSKLCITGDKRAFCFDVLKIFAAYM